MKIKYRKIILVVSIALIMILSAIPIFADSNVAGSGGDSIGTATMNGNAISWVYYGKNYHYQSYKVSIYIATKQIDSDYVKKEANFSKDYIKVVSYITSSTRNFDYPYRINLYEGKLNQLANNTKPDFLLLAKEDSIYSVKQPAIPKWTNTSGSYSFSSLVKYYKNTLNGNANIISLINDGIIVKYRMTHDNEGWAFQRYEYLFNKVKDKVTYIKDWGDLKPSIGGKVNYLVSIEPITFAGQETTDGTKRFAVSSTDLAMMNIAAKKSYILQRKWGKGCLNPSKDSIQAYIYSQAANLYLEERWLQNSSILVKQPTAAIIKDLKNQNTGQISDNEVINYLGYGLFTVGGVRNDAIKVSVVNKKDPNIKYYTKCNKNISDVMVTAEGLETAEFINPDDETKTLKTIEKKHMSIYDEYKYSTKGKFSFEASLHYKSDESKNLTEIKSIVKNTRNKDSDSPVIEVVKNSKETYEAVIKVLIPDITVHVVNQNNEPIDDVDITTPTMPTKSSTPEGTHYYPNQPSKKTDYKFTATVDTDKGKISASETATITKEDPVDEITIVINVPDDEKIIELDGSNVIRSWELTKQIVANSTSGLKKNGKSTATNTAYLGSSSCPGYTTISTWHSGRTWKDKDGKSHHTSGYYTYSKSWHSPGVHIHSGTRIINTKVREDYYLYDGGISAHAGKANWIALGLTKTLKWNQSGSYTRAVTTDMYAPLNSQTFISHRNGTNGILKLAAYMKNTSKNKNFKYAMNQLAGTTYGTNYPEGYSEQTGSTAGTTQGFKFTTANVRDAFMNLSVPYCRGSQPRTTSTGKISQSSYDTDVIVNKTYAGKNSTAKTEYGYNMYNINVGNDGMGVGIDIPSVTFNFNPTYKLYAANGGAFDKDPAKGGDNNAVWMLGDGEKYIKPINKISIEVSKCDFKVTSQWSRDAEDLNDYTTKSGNMVRGYVDGKTKVTINEYYCVQDPKFIDGSSSNSTYCDNINKEYSRYTAKLLEEYISKFKQRSYYYSNLWDLSPANCINKIVRPSKVADRSSKSQMNIKWPGSFNFNVSNDVEAFIVDADTTLTSLDGTSRSIALHNSYNCNSNGNVSSSTQTVNLKNTYQGEDSDVKTLLEKVIESNGENTKYTWYGEDYEGIILVHRTSVITLPEDLASNYAQVHTALSDRDTEVNETAERLSFSINKDMDSSGTLIDSDEFGIGMEFQFKNTDNCSINGNTIGDICVVSKPFIFNIRGSAYDND